MTQGELLAEEIEGTRDWTRKLIEDLKGDDWHFQPAPGLGHALWMCGHLASAQNSLIHVRVFGASVLDKDFAGHFPIGAPVRAAHEHDYPSVETVLQKMADIHEKTCRAVRNIGDELLAEPAFGADGAPHPHYRDKRGAISHCHRHEAFHAGQIALIRRLLGKSFLR